MKGEYLEIGSQKFTSRLFVGTGKYPSDDVCKDALIASGAELVTLRIMLHSEMINNPNPPCLGELTAEYLFNSGKVSLLPNTAGCYTAQEAINVALNSRKVLNTPFIKLEVIGEKTTLFPDAENLLIAARYLVKEGFVVLPYTSDDVVVAKKLQDVGCSAIMPLAAPIGSGLGIQNPLNLELILKAVNIPVIVDAGVGTASDATVAMELGCDGILINTAIACSKDPILMARSMNFAVQAGKMSYLAGRIPKRKYAIPSTVVNTPEG